MASSNQRGVQRPARWQPSLLLWLDLLLVTLISSLSIAQTTTSGGLTGVVTDPSGAVVPDAQVEIKNDSKGTTQSMKTDREGAYQFSFLAPARYTLTVSHDSFRIESRAVNVLLGPPVSVNVTLQVATATASVSVTAEAPLVHAENGDVSTTMNQQQVSEVPNPGNDLTYIAQTAPGAIMNTDAIGFGGSGNFSILGMPGTSNLFTLNGMNDNNNGPNINNNVTANTNNSGVTGMMLGQNEIQEATVVSDGYSGQFGGAAGSSINYLTKSGGNALHGNAQYYWNGTVLNANDWIDNALIPRNPRPADIAHQWAGSLGGPIKKDKLFFFFDTEGVRLILPYSFPQVVIPSAKFESQTLANIDKIFPSTPISNSASHNFYQQMFNLYNSTPGASAAQPGNNPTDPLGCNGWTDPTDPKNSIGSPNEYPCAVYFSQNGSAPSNDSIVSGRADWNAGASDRVFLFAQRGQGRTPLHVDPLPIFNDYCNQSTWQGHLSETHTLSPTASNQFLLGGSFIDGTCSVANSAKALAAFPTELSWFNAGIPFGLLGGFDNHYAKPFGSRTTAYQISDDFVKIRGRHKFALGVNFLRTDATRGGYNRHGTGLLLPLSMSAFFCGGVSPSQDPSKISLAQPCLVDSNHPATDFTLLQQSFPISTWNHFAFYSLGFYGQEEWHARSNLTLTLALRADHQSNPVCENRCFTRLSGPLNSLSHDPDQSYRSGILTDQKQAFANTDSIVWSPRFSFAWQPLGVSHNMVLRGGVGFFYDAVPGGLASTLGANPPVLDDYNLSGFNLAPGENNSLNQMALAFDKIFINGFNSGQSVAGIKQLNPLFVAPNFQNPANRMRSAQYQKWSLQVQQSLGASASLTVSYFGNHGIHELVQNPNANAFGFGSLPPALCTTPYVPPCADPRFGGVTELQTNAVSNYNGMVVSFEQRFTRIGGGLYQVNYTYGHALDEVSNGGLSFFTGGDTISPQDANNLRGSYGAAEYDARHSVTGNFVWEIPFKEALRGHGPDSLLKGWQISGTVLARTGNPYTVFDFTMAGNLAKQNFFGPIYSVPVAPLGPAGPCGKGAAIPAAPVPCLSDALFVQTGCETGFNAGHLGASGVCDGRLVTFAQGRNRFRTPSYVNIDFAIMKNTKVPRWENAKLGIGLQFFNFFNHANFGGPDNGSSDSSFGQIGYLEQSPTSILGSTTQANVARRMIQLKAQLQF
jgi:Carboxypeptidase regulatory-like domain